jgi:two-component system sensor histidine kinase KdpD
MTITRLSGPIDVHVVSHDYVGKGRRLPRLTSGLTVRRQLAGLIVAAVLLAVMVPICAAPRPELSLSSNLLLFLLAVIIVSLVGGFLPAVISSVAASLLLNYYFVPPIHQLTINEPENILALVVFVVTALLVSRVVDLAARRSSEAARSNAEAETLSTLAGSLLRGEQAIPALLERIRETFAVNSVTLLRRETEAPASIGAERRPASGGGLRGTWTCVDSVGEAPCLRPEDSDTEVPVGDNLIVALRGRTLAAEDQRLLAAFATEVAVAYQQRRLAEAAEAVEPLAEADRMRTALLNAVSHDLRTPIASAKAAVSSLRSHEVDWSEPDRQELLGTADSALDRLTGLVTNLLDLGRLQAGVLSVVARPIGLDDVVSRALDEVANGRPVELDIAVDLPEVVADPGLLERVVANLVENAVRYSPPGGKVRVAASAHGGAVELRVIDQGPGIPSDDREAVFAPFQRRDDTSGDGAGVGLGLAIVRGFVQAMHGTVSLEDSPGGGLIAVVSLPIAHPR